MKPYFCIFLLCLAFNAVKAQDNPDWFMFVDTTTNLIGYKNSEGTIVIEPKFTFLTQQKIFRNIMPVYESILPQDSLATYYLLKNGQKIGKDSLYLGDYFLDCENENKIRFRDPKTDKVGFFNKNGQVLIPAIYSDATAFCNGLALVVLNGKKMCWDGREYSKDNPCEHWLWVGKNLLINEKNEILLRDIDLSKFENLDFYSLEINPLNKKTNFVEFKSDNGNIYSFRDYKKEFEDWYYHHFLQNIHSSSLLNDVFTEVTIPRESNFKSSQMNNPKYMDYAWTVDSAKNVLEENRNMIKNIFNKLSEKENIISISKGDAPILLDEVKYKEYFSDCGDFRVKKFPYFEVAITTNSGLVLNTLGFIRTSEGYKLLEIH